MRWIIEFWRKWWRRRKHKHRPVGFRITETPTRGHDQSYAEGYNAGAKAAAEAVRQGNWTWEEYQEHIRKLESR